jgi:stage V sporulation protein B
VKPAERSTNGAGASKGSDGGLERPAPLEPSAEGAVLAGDATANAVVTGPSATSGDEVTREAGRGGLAVAFAKIYFILHGLLQQIVLPRVLGLDGYGAFATVNSIASITYNPVVSMSIQGVSRAVAATAPAEQPAALRRALRVHALFAVALGAGFWLLAPFITASAGAPHVTLPLQVLSACMVLYGLYAPLIGALNGQRRFFAQAGFDILAATLRTVGLVGGAYYLADRGLAVEGAVSGFVLGLTVVLVLALVVVGVGRPGTGGPSVKQHLTFVLPVLVGQVLLNLLLQADLNLLRRFSSDAALAAGLPVTAADPLVGAYRATQLFSFLPYQLLIAVNFILFPMLATAVRDRDPHAVARYVQTGTRIALIVAGLMVSVTSGLATPLIRLVIGQQAAELGGRSLELLAIGFGAFAIFGVLTTVLNSLKRERASALVTAMAATLVIALCFARVRGTAFGEELLFRTAVSTSIAIAAATLGAGVIVYRTAGAVAAPKTVLRVVIATAISVVTARFLPSQGVVWTLIAAVVVTVAYLSMLLISRELGGADLAMMKAVVAKKRR